MMDRVGFSEYLDVSYRIVVIASRPFKENTYMPWHVSANQSDEDLRRTSVMKKVLKRMVKDKLLIAPDGKNFRLHPGLNVQVCHDKRRKGSKWVSAAFGVRNDPTLLDKINNLEVFLSGTNTISEVEQQLHDVIHKFFRVPAEPHEKKRARSNSKSSKTSTVSRTSSPVPLLNSASRSSSTRPSSVSDEETSRKSRQPAMPAPPGISPQQSVNIQAKTQNSVLRPSSPVSEDEIEDALRRPVSLSPSPSTFEEMKTQGNISRYISRPQPTTNPIPPAFQKSAPPAPLVTALATLQSKFPDDLFEPVIAHDGFWAVKCHDCPDQSYRIAVSSSGAHYYLSNFQSHLSNGKHLNCVAARLAKEGRAPTKNPKAQAPPQLKKSLIVKLPYKGPWPPSKVSSYSSQPSTQPISDLVPRHLDRLPELRLATMKPRLDELERRDRPKRIRLDKDASSPKTQTNIAPSKSASKLQSSNERRSVVSDSGSYEDTESETYLQLDTVKILRLEQKFKKLEAANSDLNEQAKTTTRKERELEERLRAIENTRANSDSVAERFRVLEELVLSQAEVISNLKAQLIEQREDMERQRQLDMQEMQGEVATLRSFEAQNTQRFEQMRERIQAVEKEKEAQTSRISSLSNRVSLQDTQRQEDRRPFIWEQNAAQT